MRLISGVVKQEGVLLRRFPKKDVERIELGDFAGGTRGVTVEIAQIDDAAVEGRAGSRSTRPVTAAPPEHETAHERGERLRRVLVHASGFRQSPYADIVPQGIAAADTRSQVATRGRAGSISGASVDQSDPTVDKDSGRPTPRKLWHSSNGSSGW